VTTINADHAQWPSPQFDKPVIIKLHRISFIENEPVNVRVAPQVLLEALQVPCARTIIIEILVRKQVDSHCRLTHITKKVKQDEKPAVMHAYFRDSTRHTRPSLLRGKADDSLDCAWHEPALHQVISVLYVRT
jgi:hypothetical protein